MQLTHQVTMNEWNTSEQIKTWATPTKSDSKDASMTTPIKEHASIDRTDSKISRQVHLEAMNEQIKTWATPTKAAHKHMSYSPEAVMNRLDKGTTDDERTSTSQAGIRENTGRNQPLDLQRNVESEMGGNVNGFAHWVDYERLCQSYTSIVDEIALLGNGVVPATAELAFRILFNKFL
jgi:hypothetical protein